MHYPEFFDDLSVMDLIIFDDQTEGFSDFEQGLDWTFKMAGYVGKRHIAEGPNQA